MPGEKWWIGINGWREGTRKMGAPGRGRMAGREVICPSVRPSVRPSRRRGFEVAPASFSRGIGNPTRQRGEERTPVFPCLRGGFPIKRNFKAQLQNAGAWFWSGLAAGVSGFGCADPSAVQLGAGLCGAGLGQCGIGMRDVLLAECGDELLFFGGQIR